MNRKTLKGVIKSPLFAQNNYPYKRYCNCAYFKLCLLVSIHHICQIGTQHTFCHYLSVIQAYYMNGSGGSLRRDFSDTRQVSTRRWVFYLQSNYNKSLDPLCK